MSTNEDIVQGIDHLIVMVRDLDRAERIWQSLGFATTPRGFHRTGGTANHLIMLDRTYIELLGSSGQTSAAAAYSDMMADPGLWGTALRGSAQALFQLWSAAGLQPSTPVDLARGVEIEGRDEVARFRLAMLERTPELPFLLFCCEHVTPQFVWHPGVARHPNGARRLRELIVLAESGATRSSLERVLGRPATRSAGGAVLRLGESRISLLSAASFEQRFRQAPRFGTRREPLLAGFGLASDNLNRAREFAERAGHRVWETVEGGFFVHLPDEGVMIEWSSEQ